MRYQDTTAIRFLMNGSTLEAVTPAGNVAVCEITGARHATLKVEVSPANGKYSVMADGVAVAEELSFLNACETVDRMYIQTTDEAIGTIDFDTVRIYTGYYINEKFLNADKGTIPEDWTTTGNVTAVYKTGTQGPDKYSASMTDGATLSREVSYEQDGFWAEYQLLIPDNMDKFSMVLEDEEGNSFEVAAICDADNKYEFGYYDETGKFVTLYDEYRTNLWYHVMLKQTDEGGMLYLNHKLKAEAIELPFDKFTKMSFVAGNGQAYLDDIVLKDWIPYPEDYVPQPVAVEKDEDDALIGLQSCNLWVEGQHYGYDWLTEWDERTPYLGYYDETVTEAADWELLWKVEHGIDFELFCWYRNQGGNDEPIKSNRNGIALHEGYFNARYSDMMKFAITWECAGGPVSGSEDFRENVVPYWIEQYFKDDRYLVIDNKPVVGMYSVSTLMSYFGNTAEGVKAELDYLRAECVKAGFDGCYVIMSNSKESDIEKITNAGFDGQYAYTWGEKSYIVDTQKNSMISFDQKADAAGGTAGIIPVASMGWDSRAWGRTAGGYCTPEDYTEVLRWIREDFMPTLDSDSLGSKMILLDNWNEYSEGHFIMPANLYGFGYLDAVREIFGDGTEHTDVRPTSEQLARINHMYVQDREVDKLYEEEKTYTEIQQGYYFETKGDQEGWTIGTYKGEELDVENLRVEDGAMKGNTYLGDEKRADPAVLSPAVAWNAKEVIQIRVRMKASVIADAPQLYFITDSDTAFNQTKCVVGIYAQSEADEDGYSEVVFDVTSNEAWKGTITQIRVDPITVAGSFEIDSIEAMCRNSTGDATVTMDGDKIYNETPIKLVNGTVMFPVAELSELAAVQWCDRLDGTAVEVYVEGRNLYRFPYASATMIVNGETTTLTQGAAAYDGVIYIPLADLFKAEGYVVEWNETDKILSINEWVDPDDPYDVVKAWEFNSDKEGWYQGGTTVVSQSAGALVVTPPTATGDYRPRIYTPNLTAEAYGSGDITHIRMRLKTGTTSAEVSEATLFMLLRDSNSKTIMNLETSYAIGSDDYVELVIPLSGEWDETTKLKDVVLYLFGSSGNEALAKDGVAVYIDSVELLKEKDEGGSTEGDPSGGDASDPSDGDAGDPSGGDAGDGGAESGSNEKTYTVVKTYQFESGKEGWYQGGSTGVSQASGALVVTPASDNKPRTYSPDISAEAYGSRDITHIRLRLKTSAVSTEVSQATLYMQLRQWTGTANKAFMSLEGTYEVGSDDYVELLIPCSGDWAEDIVLKDMVLYLFGGQGNAKLAGVTVYIDSVELLKENVTSE